ncbi:hypothetical protein SAMN05421810_106209 [Amycolatopsis arida]|uniref:Uncharacterized protein n=1 Tax=Amycolatopsis arida TaxID=587909 RepID=A0A1I5XRD7_9PSEU|nr:DUF6221 family protein [Amycolatopsis arida]TDX97310.1 hypothetical protein CLV69_102413 [Amycolatopsis arida]SFQ34386.1 hypothetical protein SAMN05421810_106209 [Amycolatopsis arida]
MADLVEFLFSCFDVDERVALAAGEGPWHVDRMRGDRTGCRVTINNEEELIATVPCQPMFGRGTENAHHIVHYNPLSVLLDIDAKRRLVAEHLTTVAPRVDGEELRVEYQCRTCHPRPADNWCRTLRLLARPYLSHPGYRREWRP